VQLRNKLVHSLCFGVQDTTIHNPAIPVLENESAEEESKKSAVAAQ
jgi:hypothetical protein